MSVPFTLGVQTFTIAARDKRVDKRLAAGAAPSISLAWCAFHSELRIVKNIIFLFLLGASLGLVPSPAGAQTGNAAPPSSSTQDTAPDAAKDKRVEKEEQSQRVLGVMPQFSVTSRHDAPALTTKEKFNLFVKSSTDPFVFVAVGFQAGLTQATDGFDDYGQGAAGYGKRYGATLADNTSSNFFANFAYPVLFKEDPRYFRLGEGTVKHRILYALEQEFVCHTDKGGRSFNFSNVLGAFTAGGISNLYYPPEDRGAGLTMSRSAIALAYGSAGGLISEFWVDIDKKLFHKKQTPTEPHSQP